MEKVVFRIYWLWLEVVRFGDVGIYCCFVKVYVWGFGIWFCEVVSVCFWFFFVYVWEEGVVLEVVVWLVGGIVYWGEIVFLLCNIFVWGGFLGLWLVVSWWVE